MIARDICWGQVDLPGGFRAQEEEQQRQPQRDYRLAIDARLGQQACYQRVGAFPEAALLPFFPKE